MPRQSAHPGASRARARRSPGSRPTDDQLLDAALEIFAEHGFRQTTLERIAEQAGCTKPTLYAHFGDKEAIYRATVEREAERARSWLFSAYDSADAQPLAEQVRVGVMALFEFATAHPAAFRLLLVVQDTDPATAIRQDLIDGITQRVIEQARRLTARGEPQKNVDVLAAMIVGACLHGARQASLTGADEHRAGELATTFLLGAVRNVDPDLP